MKLHQIPRESRLNIESSDGSKYITFHRLDGLYSYCSTEKGSICHLHVGTELQKEKNGTYSLVGEVMTPVNNNI